MCGQEKAQNEWKYDYKATRKTNTDQINDAEEQCDDDDDDDDVLWNQGVQTSYST